MIVFDSAADNYAYVRHFRPQSASELRIAGKIDFAMYLQVMRLCLLGGASFQLLRFFAILRAHAFRCNPKKNNDLRDLRNQLYEICVEIPCKKRAMIAPAGRVFSATWREWFLSKLFSFSCVSRSRVARNDNFILGCRDFQSTHFVIRALLWSRPLESSRAFPYQSRGEP